MYAMSGFVTLEDHELEMIEDITGSRPESANPGKIIQYFDDWIAKMVIKGSVDQAQKNVLVMFREEVRGFLKSCPKQDAEELPNA